MLRNVLAISSAAAQLQTREYVNVVFGHGSRRNRRPVTVRWCVAGPVTG